jgi:heterotetrameric sarcosine oxidase delta subunit
MMLIPCPHCGPRNSSEFRYLGEQKARPGSPAADADPAVWRAYLYGHTNAAGWTTEGWWHGTGCGAFLTLERDTVTNEIRSVACA